MRFVTVAMHQANIFQFALDNAIVPASDREVELQTTRATVVKRFYLTHFKTLLAKQLTHRQPQGFVSVRCHAHTHFLSGTVDKPIFVRTLASELLACCQSNRHDRK